MSEPAPLRCACCGADTSRTGYFQLDQAAEVLGKQLAPGAFVRGECLQASGYTLPEVESHTFTATQ